MDGYGATVLTKGEELFVQTAEIGCTQPDHLASMGTDQVARGTP